VARVGRNDRITRTMPIKVDARAKNDHGEGTALATAKPKNTADR
jgi:hypothetical protein